MEINGLLAAGIYDWPVISQISWLLGQVMNGIYNLLDAIGINNIGISIIIFTIIVYTLLIPLTIKQQKFSKMQSVMTPEIRKIQKKYEGKRDQASMLKQQEEMNAVYDKYGTKMSSGCLPSLIQMLFLFGLYPVVQNIPRYVGKVHDVYMPLVEKIQSVAGSQAIMEKIGEASPVLMNPDSYDYSKANTLVEALYKFQDATWNTLVDKIPQVEGLVNSTRDQIDNLNQFLGVNIGAHPWNLLMDALKDFSILGIILAVIIPVLAGLTQFISVKLSQAGSTSMMDDKDNPMAGSMKTMMYTMPLISVVFGFTLPAGLGLYWVASAAVRCIQQLAINKYLSKKSVEDIIAENQKKMKKKIEKKGTSAKEINRMATTSTRNVGNSSRSGKSQAEKDEKIRRAQEMAKNAKPGSLTAKANLVRDTTAARRQIRPIRLLLKRKERNKMKGSIRVSARTLDDAITEASIQLGVTSDKMEYNVIEKGSAGFLGIGMKQAVIEAWKKEEPEEEKQEIFTTFSEEEILEGLKEERPVREKKEKKHKEGKREAGKEDRKQPEAAEEKKETEVKEEPKTEDKKPEEAPVKEEKSKLAEVGASDNKSCRRVCSRYAESYEHGC